MLITHNHSLLWLFKKQENSMWKDRRLLTDISKMTQGAGWSDKNESNNHKNIFKSKSKQYRRWKLECLIQDIDKVKEYQPESLEEKIKATTTKK